MVYYTIVRRVGNDRAAKDAARAEALRRLLPRFGVPEDTPVARDGRGRIYLPDHPEIDVNFSHADPFTVAVAGTARVGVDMEAEDGIRDPEGLARRFFTPRETEAVTSSQDLRGAVLTVWTRKEAMGKYIGTGLAATMGDCTFSPPTGTSFFEETLTVGGVRYVLTVLSHEPPIRMDS